MTVYQIQNETISTEINNKIAGIYLTKNNILKHNKNEKIKKIKLKLFRKNKHVKLIRKYEIMTYK